MFMRQPTFMSVAHMTRRRRRGGRPDAVCEAARLASSGDFCSAALYTVGMSRDDTRPQTAVRRHRQVIGYMAEFSAAAVLMAKGYRILARRVRTRLGEIDLIAVRGQRLAFVEVKARGTLAACEASITASTRRRVRRAATLWMGKNTRYQMHDPCFDLVFVLPRRLPRHLPDAL